MLAPDNISVLMNLVMLKAHTEAMMEGIDSDCIVDTFWDIEMRTEGRIEYLVSLFPSSVPIRLIRWREHHIHDCFPFFLISTGIAMVPKSLEC
jgi:hypothetical protein